MKKDSIKTVIEIGKFQKAGAENVGLRIGGSR